MTLQILKALIEKSPKDLPLIAPTVLKILDLVLGSNDITMVEASLPMFEAFCEHHDASALFADQAYLAQYEGVVKTFATLASTRHTPGGGKAVSRPVAMRWRNAGLEAIKSVVSAVALSSPSGRQLDVLVPMVLENLWTDNEDFLEVLLARAQMEEKVDTEKMLKRRTSIATVRTVDTAGGDPNPLALSGTAFDVDKLAEEDIGVLAMQCLKLMFVQPNRPQVHTATSALLRFTSERVAQQEVLFRTDPKTGRDSGWAIKLFELISRWTPVQDRYVILVTAMDYLSRATTLTDETLPLHLVLMAMIGSLLRSDVNLIGLSVMDVLLGMLQLVKRLTHLPGGVVAAAPQKTGTASVSGPSTSAVAPNELRPPTPDEKAEAIISQRKDLLARIQQCIGDLATHVYYADQISDMIATILLRLKPSAVSSSASSSPQGEKAEAGPAASAAGPLGEPQGQIDALFSVNVAKCAALRAVKQILLVANPRTRLTGNVSLSRNRVPITVWEGTHWLLRDPDGAVRKAYVDALMTWLDRETTPADARAPGDEALQARSSMRTSKELQPVSLAKRAASSASTRDKAGKAAAPKKSHFLELLHLAVYDNALQFVDFETDIVLLHVLLSKLVLRLGINAVRCGLPMIFRLQEEIQEAETPIAKVRIGSLVHGYFWIVTDYFDIDSSVVGRPIHNEIQRRRAKGFWVEGVHVPPPLLELVGTPGLARPQPKMPLKEIEDEALLPFDDRSTLVECIAAAYQQSSISPPTSPAASPGRSFSHHVLSQSTSSASAATIPNSGAAHEKKEHELPLAIREQLLTEWSRDSVLVAAQEGSKSASINGSRTGTTGTSGRQAYHARLGITPAVNADGGASPHASQQNLRPTSAGNNLGVAPTKLRNASSVRSGVSPSPMGRRGGTPAAGEAAAAAAGAQINGSDADLSSRGFVTSVDQLKMALAGEQPPLPVARGLTGHGIPGRVDSSATTMTTDSADSVATYDDDEDEDSVDDADSNEVDAAMTHSDASFGVPAAPHPTAATTATMRRPASSSANNNTLTPGAGASRTRSTSGSRERRPGSSDRPGGPLSSNPPHEAGPVLTDDSASSGASSPEPAAAPNGSEQQTAAGDSSVPPVPKVPLLPTLLTGRASETHEDLSASLSSLPERDQPKRGRMSEKKAAARPSTGSKLQKQRTATSSVGSKRVPSATTGASDVDEFFAAHYHDHHNHHGHHQGERAAPPPALDLQALLKGIDSRAGESGLGHISQPPY